MTLTYILNENNLTTDSDDYVAIVSTDGSATRVAVVGKNRRIAKGDDFVLRITFCVSRFTIHN